MFYLFCILVSCTLIYVLILIYLAKEVDRKNAPKGSDVLKVSVIVALRNEEQHVKALLSSLLQQDYPLEQSEIIIIDDDSTDQTPAILTEIASQNPSMPLVILKSKSREGVASPKKHALAQGIERAQGEVLLFTDADCIPPPTWVRTMVSYFEPEVGMVIGCSPLELPPPRSVFTFFQAIESISLAALAFATTSLGRPATCTGRNLAYRKSVFKQVGGFEDIKQFPSGDDDLFLKLVMDKTDWRIAYAFDPDAVVPSKTTARLKSFIYQRLRHASKTLHYGWKMRMLLASAYIYNFLLFLALISAFFTLATWPFFLWFMKMAGELTLVGSFTAAMRRNHYLFFFPLASIIHIPYVIVFGALGPFIKVRWKS